MKSRTYKQLRQLSRIELLSILYEQERELTRLRAKCEQTEAALLEKRIKLESCGSIAKAALELSGVFEAAQTAADLYIQSVMQRYSLSEAGRGERAATALK